MSEGGGFDIREVTQGGPRQQGQQAQQGQGLLPVARARARAGGCAPFANNPLVTLGGSCVILVLISVLVIISLGSLLPTEYGLKYNRVTKQVDTSYVYRAGRHLIGPMSSLLVFPATVQTLEFSDRPSAAAPPLTTRTNEGLALTLHVAFQYHLIQEEVADLYKLANTYYESLFMKIARDTLLKAAATYAAPQYWEERPKIGAEMLELLNQALSQSHAFCTGLQLLVIELPTTYEDSIVATQVQKQDIKTKENAQKAALIRAQIKVMIAGYQNNITVTLSGAQANATLTTKSAEARASQMKIDAEAKAFDTVQKELPISPEAFVGYQRNFAYQTMPNATFLVGIPNAVAIVGGSTATAPTCSAGARAALSSTALGETLA